MEAAREKLLLTGHAVAESQPLHAVTRVGVGVQRELYSSFDSAVAFGDICTFLTSGRLSDKAEQLASLAEELLAETCQDLQRSKPYG